MLRLTRLLVSQPRPPPFAGPRAAVGIAVVGIAAGLKLAIYAEADDAPGGVVIGVLLTFGALSLALWLGLRKPQARAN
jgi:hypothetical protein